MGGNIFQNLKRLNKSEFNDLVEEVSLLLFANLITSDTTEIKPTRSYHSKESFGDMDLIVTSDHLRSDWIPRLKQVFNLQDDEFSKNGNVASFKYKDFQIDLILTPQDEYTICYHYFSWNDLSNLMGRVTYKHGIKFGHKGIFVGVKDGSHELGEIHVTNSVQDLCDYFGWNYAEWNAGFETMEDAYKWVVQTPYFNKEIFAYENRNHAAVIRDRKRPNYANFLVWLETQTDLPEYPYESTLAKGGYYVRQPYFDMLCHYWPHVREEYDSMLREYEENKLFKSKFNGDIISQITGLQNQELGKFIKWCKATFERIPELRGWILQDSFNELVGHRFFSSLFWHYTNNQIYGKSDFSSKPLGQCECGVPATKRYYIDDLCDKCYQDKKDLDGHDKLKGLI